MPVTFLAHQAPVLPIARRWPHLTDGVALIVGSMTPDFAYVLNGSRFAVWAHGLPGLVLFCVPVAVAVSWIIVRTLAPVVPANLSDLGGFHLRDYRGLATHDFGWVRTPTCAILGALSHVALDQLTHEWGWPARNVDWYQEPLLDATVLGRQWAPYRIAQYAGHVVLTALAVFWLWRNGTRRWLTDRAAQVPERRSRTGTIVLSVSTVVGFVVTLVWVIFDGEGSATDTMRLAAGAFGGLCVGAASERSWR